MNFSPGWTDYAFLALFGFLFLLSGCLTWALAWHRSGSALEEKDSGKASCLETALGCLLCSMAVTSIILLTTAEMGVFRIRFWLLLLTAYDLLVFLILLRVARFSLWKLKKTTDPPKNSDVCSFSRALACHFHKSDLAALVLALLTFFVLNRPAEFVATYRDPGEYLNIAVKLSESGSLRFREPDFQQFNTREKQTLFLQTPLEQAPFPEILPGFYLADASKGELLPQFFPLYPLWLSLCFKLWRFDGLFLFNILMGTLGVLLLVPLSQRIFHSRIVGLAAAVLVASNAGQIWLSRSPFSEMLAQVFLLAGLWLLAVGMAAKVRRVTVLAGVLFGLCLFVRIDSVLILLALTPLLLCRSIDRKAFLLPLGAVTIWAAVHVFLFSFPYFWNVLETLSGLAFRWKVAGLVAVSAVMTALFFSAMAMRGRRMTSTDPLRIVAPLSSNFSKRCIFWVLVVMLGATSTYGVFIRPHLDSAREVVPLPSPHVGTVPLYNELNWTRLSWYLTPVGLALALLGAIIGIHQMVIRGSTVMVPFALILTVFAGFYLYKSRAFPDNYWVVRRYIEVAIPGCLLLACLALRWLCGLLSRLVPPRLSVVVSALLFLCVWGAEIRAVAPFWKERELAGTLNQMELLASLNQKADILLLEQGTFQEFFASPLKCIFQESVYPLASLNPDVPALESLAERWLSEGKRIHMLSFLEQTELQSRKLRFVPRNRFELKTRVAEATYERLPRSMMLLNYSVQIYDVQLAPPAERPKVVTLNMDYNFGYSTKGFHPAETSSDRETFRWTSGPASIDLPQIPVENDVILSLSLAQDVPAHLPASPVRVFFNDNLIAERQLPTIFEVMRWEIPSAWLTQKGKNRVAFDSDTYSPAEFGNSEDQRQLGLMLDGVALQSKEPISDSKPLQLDLGSEADVLDADFTGFFGREPDSYRWTRAEAEVKLPVAVDTSTPLRLSLRAVKSSPDPAFRQWLSLSLDGFLAGKVELVGTGTEFRVYEFVLPKLPASAKGSVVRLTVSPAWNPSQAGSSVDSRTLGCAVDWIRIEAR